MDRVDGVPEVTIESMECACCGKEFSYIYTDSDDMPAPDAIENCDVDWMAGPDGEVPRIIPECPHCRHGQYLYHINTCVDAHKRKLGL